MRFDWAAFCRDNGLEFVERGPSVSKGNVNIRCPYCDDRGTHMGLSLNVEKPFWACWRCRSGGRDPTRLVATLLNVPAYRAKNVVAEYGAPPVDDFEALFTEQEQPGKAFAGRYTPRSLPRECRPIDPARPAALRFLRYMAEDRGFGDDAVSVCATYRLHYAISGEQAWRVVLPVYGVDGELLAWTGRTVYKEAGLRYLADPHKGTREVVANVGELLSIRGPLLGIAEGPIDFLKLDYYGREQGLRATCTFGVSYSEKQVWQLAEVCRRFDRVLVMYDPEAYMNGATLAEQLTVAARKTVTPVSLSGHKDYGDFTGPEVSRLVENLRAGV